MSLEPPNVVAAGDVAEMLGVHRNSFARYHASRIPGAKHTSSGAIWERPVALAYVKQHQTGRPYLTALELWRLTDPTETIYTRSLLVATGLSGEKSISHTTVVRYLKQLGEIPR